MHEVDCMAASSRCRCLSKLISRWPSRFVFSVLLGDTSPGHITVAPNLFWACFSAHVPVVCVLVRVCVCVMLSTIVRCLLCQIPFLPVCNSVIPSKPCWSHSVLLCLSVCVCVCVCVCPAWSVCCVAPVLSGCVSSRYVSSLAPSAAEQQCVCVCVCVFLACMVPPVCDALWRSLQSSKGLFNRAITFMFSLLLLCVPLL